MYYERCYLGTVMCTMPLQLSIAYYSTTSDKYMCYATSSVYYTCMPTVVCPQSTVHWASCFLKIATVVSSPISKQQEPPRANCAG